MLDDGAHRLVEFLRQVPCSLQVNDVVVAEFLALQLLAVRNALARAVGVQRRLLMRVLAVAQIEGFVEGESQRFGKAAAAGEIKLSAVVRRSGNRSRVDAIAES